MDRLWRKTLLLSSKEVHSTALKKSPETRESAILTLRWAKRQKTCGDLYPHLFFSVILTFINDYSHLLSPQTPEPPLLPHTPSAPLFASSLGLLLFSFFSWLLFLCSSVNVRGILGSLLFSICNEPNCVPIKFLYWNPNPSCRVLVFRDGAFES